MYSHDVRRIAFQKLQIGWSLRKVAKCLEVSASTILRWRREQSMLRTCNAQGRDRVFGSMKPGRPKRKIDNATQGAIALALQSKSFLSMRELGTQLRVHAEGLRTCSDSTIRRYVKSMGFARKRLSNRVLGECSPERIQAFRSRYSELATSSVDNDDRPLIVSIDECHFSERVTPNYCWLKEGVQRPSLRRKHGGWKSVSLLLAICSDGRFFIYSKPGSVKRSDFIVFLRQLPLPSNSVILLDNCSVHHGCTQVFEEKAFKPLYLPPYCPQFQPVELAFSKIKQAFRQRWPWDSGVQSHVLECSNLITCDDIKGWFRQCDRIRSQGVP